MHCPYLKEKEQTSTSLPIHSAAQPRGGTTIDYVSAQERSVRRELDSIISEYQQTANRYSLAIGFFWNRICSALDGGKLTRPRLVMKGHEAFGGQDTQRAVTLRCAFKILHGSLLMHDGVIDRDFTRRGKPTLSAQYRVEALAQGKSPADSQHTGHAAAIIAGHLIALRPTIGTYRKAAAGKVVARFV